MGLLGFFFLCVASVLQFVLSFKRGSCGPSKVHWSTLSTREKVLCHMWRFSEGCGLDPMCYCWGTLWETLPWPTECLSTRTSSPSASSTIRFRPVIFSVSRSGFRQLTRRLVCRRWKAEKNPMSTPLMLSWWRTRRWMFPMQFSGTLPHPETTQRPNGGNGHFFGHIHRCECVHPSYGMWKM